MTINVSKDVESSINAAVQNGKFASAADMITKLVWEYSQRTQQPQAASHPVAHEEATAQERKPIWEVFQEISASVPAEIWDALPTDLSEQHDHYIYGTPKQADA